MMSRRNADRPEAVPYNKDKRPRLNRTRESTLGTGIRKPIPENNNEHMKVFVRVRPFSARESSVGGRRVCLVENEKYLTFDPKENMDLFFFKGTAQRGRDMTKRVNKNMFFEFSRVFDEDSTNEEVFDETAKNIVTSVLEGYNCSIFAYGATGAGKTYTMLGTPENPGINYKTIVELLKQVQDLNGSAKVTLGVTYIEVYNENVRDLLHPDSGMLQLREEAGRVVVAGLKIETICSEESEELFDLLNMGNQNRTQHPTDSNAESSRSHAIFQVHVQMENKGDIKVSKLSMIDLAGSERGAATGCKGMRFKEGSNINKSLLALGNCINALADGLRHVPYRDSKLTRILKDSLGGNCRTMMIANVSPSSFAYEDTYNTLKYAARAKSIKSKVTRNVVAEKVSMAKYAQMLDELKELQQQLATIRSNPSNVASLPNLEDWEKKIADVMEAKKQTVTEMLTLQSEQLKMEWRLKYKCDAQPYLDNVKDDDAVTRSQVSIDQLTGRLQAVCRRQEEYKPVLAEIQKQEEALEQEIHAHPHAKSLLKELEVHRLKIAKEEHAICMNHDYDIVRLQEQQVQRSSAAQTNIATVAKEMYSLLSGYGHSTRDLDQRYQEAVKMLDGLKSVTFDDENIAPPEHFKLLRLSMGRVHEKQVVTEEEMNEHKKKFQPLQERPQNRVNTIAPVSKSTLPRTPVFKNVHIVNKENAGVALKQRPLPPGTPGMKAFVQKAVSRNPHLIRMHPYGMTSRVTKLGVTKPTPKPIRMNKLAAARMAAAVR